MAIEKTICKQIHVEIDKLPSDELGGIYAALLEDHLFGLDISDSPEVYLDQPPDTHPEEAIEHANLLGSYTPMKSPGRLILYQNNLHDFFWCLVKDTLFKNPALWVSRSDLKYTADMIIRKTWWHEQFHFCCDVFRHLFSTRFNSMTEEALAVAYSRHKILENRNSGRSTTSSIHPLFLGLIMDKAFAFTSLGYRDWPKYIDQAVFDQRLTEYAMNKNIVLEYNGVDLPALLKGMRNSLLAKEDVGYVEKIA